MFEKKRVAMFAINPDPMAPLGSQEGGGKEVYVRYLAQELSRLGWKVDIFTRLDSLHKKPVVNINKSIRLIRLKAGPAKFVPKTEISNLLPEIFDKFLEFNSANNSDDFYQLFHGHRWDGGYVALSAKKKFGRPLVQTFHSLGIKLVETKKKYLNYGNDNEYFTKRLNIEHQLVRDSDSIICLSDAERRDLKSLYGCSVDKISVVPGGVDFGLWKDIDKERAREYSMLKKDKFIILFVGRFEWRKGLGTLITSARLIKDEIPNLQIVVVGGKIFGRRKDAVDVREYNRVKELAVNAGVDNIVEFKGNVDNKALLNFYRSADVFVVPSYYEPFGLVILEGMANKVPVVASRVGGPASIIKDGETGLLFEPRNALDLKNKVVEIYKSKDLAKKLTDLAYREVLEKYSWKTIIKEISGVYDTLIKGDTSST